MEINSAGAGKLGMVITLALCNTGVETRAYDPAHALPTSPPRGCLASLFGG